jgi:hypothetical protein
MLSLLGEFSSISINLMGRLTGLWFNEELRLEISGIEFTYFAQWLEIIAVLEQEAKTKSEIIYTT